MFQRVARQLDVGLEPQFLADALAVREDRLVADRFCAINGGDVMPVYSEAEDSILPLTAPASHLLGACSEGIKWVNDHLTGMSMTTATFTDGMAQ